MYYLGEFTIGDSVTIALDNRMGDPINQIGDILDTAAPKWSIYDNTGTLVTGSFEDQSMTQVTLFEEFYLGTPFTVTSPPFTEGEDYFVTIKETTGDPNIGTFLVQKFRIKNHTQAFREREWADDDAELLNSPNSILGRIHTIEQNQTDVIFPRLQRALGLLGENSIIDAYIHDDAGNITSCRIRVFNSKTNRDAATAWTDTENDADPAVAKETGETSRYALTATHLAPRLLRTDVNNVIDTDTSDLTYGNYPGSVL